MYPEWLEQSGSIARTFTKNSSTSKSTCASIPGGDSDENSIPDEFTPEEVCDLCPEEAQALEAQRALEEAQRVLEDEVAQHQACDFQCPAEVAQKIRSLEESILAAKAAGISDGEKCLAAAELQRRTMHNIKQDLKGAVRVFCRVRPMGVGRGGRLEMESGRPVTTATGTMSVEVNTAGEFIFDAVFDGDASQEEIFVECRSVVQSAVDGYPVTLLCYGQTGAGKTHTMYGNAGNFGIAPRAISEPFRLCDAQKQYRECRVYASMVELHNNNLADLLKIAGYVSQTQGSDSESPKSSRRRSINVSLEAPIEIECSSAEELSGLLWDGFAQRQVAATAMNGDSSRSHVVLLVRVHGRDLATNEEQTGYMALVDLAGSERLKKSASTGEQQKESIEINRSLTAIGDVVEALARGLRGPQVPYRNHKLTLLLQDALGGSSKMLMVVNVAPSNAHCKETVVALRFGQRAGNVINRVAGCRGILTFQSASQRGPTTRKR